MGNADELNEDFMTSQGSLADFVTILNQEQEGLSNKMFVIASPTLPSSLRNFWTSLMHIISGKDGAGVVWGLNPPSLQCCPGNFDGRGSHQRGPLQPK